MKPKVSVIIPTYNYAGFISQAINSIASQTYPSECIEIIVVDDGSKDNTQVVLKDYIDKGVIKYFYQDNRGKAHATCKAIQKSTGKYIFNLDADDFYFSTKIEQTVNIFESDSQIVHVATAAKKFDNETQSIQDFERLPHEISDKVIDGNRLIKYFFNNNLLYGGGSTYSARSSVLKKIDIPGEVDMFIDEFLILAILPFGKSFFIKEPLSIWRGHSYNYSGVGKTKEERLSKGLRLLNSSKAVLKYLKDCRYDADVIKIYELKYSTSVISLKEEFEDKSIRDIFSYAYKIFFKLRPEIRLIRKYHVLNYFLPFPFFYIKKFLRRYR